jgi:predicted PurR-regulated permease PerM
MESNNVQNPASVTFEKIVDTIIRLAVLFFLLGWCFTILKPFVLILMWAAVIAIAIYPLYSLFIKMFRKRKILASVALTLLMLSIVIIPSWPVTRSLFEGVSHFEQPV